MALNVYVPTCKYGSLCGYDALYCWVIFFFTKLTCLSFLGDLNNTLYFPSQYDLLFYKLSNLWGSHEGSLLVWLFSILIVGYICHLVMTKFDNLSCFWTLFFPYLLSTYLFYRYCLSYYISTAIFNGTDLVSSGVTNFCVDGFNISPLLHDTLMGIHPLILFFSYGAIFFGIVISRSVILDRKNSETKLVFIWILITWCLLSIAIALGSYWAYYELGWGGWWFWDPVENYSAVPWFLLTGCLHYFKNMRAQAVSLIIALVVLTNLIGVLSIRYGLSSQSVHSFADSSISSYEFYYLILFILSVSIANLVKSTFTSFKSSLSTQTTSLIYLLFISFGLLLIAFTTGAGYYNTFSNFTSHLNALFFCSSIVLIYLAILNTVSKLSLKSVTVSVIMLSAGLVYPLFSSIFFLILLAAAFMVYKKFRLTTLAHFIIGLLFIFSVSSTFAETSIQTVVDFLQFFSFSKDSKIIQVDCVYPLVFTDEICQGYTLFEIACDKYKALMPSNYYFPLDGQKHISPSVLTDLCKDQHFSLIASNMLDGCCLKLMFHSTISFVWSFILSLAGLYFLYLKNVFK
uniref:Heme lyase n=1 Tax=Ophirina amphinema TaxID=2108040 RepID=A0A348AYV3_9EUKA|nr:heme lyase [Ophirina amphinema]